MEEYLLPRRGLGVDEEERLLLLLRLDEIAGVRNFSKEVQDVRAA